MNHFTHMHQIQQAMGILAEIQSKGKVVSASLFGTCGIFDVHIYNGRDIRNAEHYSCTLLLYAWQTSPFNNPDHINKLALKDLQAIADGIEIMKIKTDGAVALYDIAPTREEVFERSVSHD